MGVRLPLLPMKRRDFLASTLVAAGNLIWSGCGANASSSEPEGLSGEVLKTELISRLEAAGAYEVKIADPLQGFSHGIPVRNPRSLFPGCRSVVACLIPNPAYSAFTDGVPGSTGGGAFLEVDDYPYTHPLVMDFMKDILRTAVGFLGGEGHRVYSNFGTARPWPYQIQDKMCAYEAGLGSYGRSGLILHPELGSRIALFVFLTDAKMPPDPKAPDSCIGCRHCERDCPGGCFDSTKDYPESHSVHKCHATRERTKRETDQDCQTCVDTCPVTKHSNEELTAWLEAKARGKTSL